ncbi:MAG: leucine-rich repeat protein [Bacteroidaceae bacterium]|nr:leucine-rich repeat protein [Bacteroidaceae bacterium]
MKIKDIALSAAYVGQRVVKTISIGAVEVWSAIKYIIFKDKVVEQICAETYGDGIGVTEEDVKAVSNLGNEFKGNTEITSFEEFEKFSSIELLGVTVGDSVTPFRNCTSLEKIKYPNSLRRIGHWAFDGCTSLKTIIPPSIEYLGIDAYYNVPIEGEIYLPNLKTLGSGGSINSPKITRVTDLGAVTVIPNNFMRENKNLTYFKIPSTVTKLNGTVCLGCTNLEDIGTDLSHVLNFDVQQNFWDTPKLKNAINLENVESLGTYGNHFRNSGIPSIRFGKLSVITDGVCYGCKNLTKVELSDNTTSIGSSSFYGCPVLTEVIVNSVEPPTLGANAFANGSEDMIFYVPDQSVTAYRGASGWSAYADRILPMEAYLYGIITFADPAVEAVCLANFDTNCSGYLSKEEAKAVTDLGEVFRGNTEITSFNELLDFTGISSLHKSAFANCENLREISIPIVTNLGPACFYYCSRLISIYMYNDTPPYVGYSVFDGTRDAVVYVPDDSIEAYKNADTWKSHARRVLGMSNRDRLITDNYTKNAGQSYGTVGGNISFTTDNTFEWAKIPIGEVEAVVIRSTDAIPSSLIQYVDSNGKILHLDATDSPHAVSRYVISNIEGVTHVYVSSAAGTMRIYGKQ